MRLLAIGDDYEKKRATSGEADANVRVHGEKVSVAGPPVSRKLRHFKDIAPRSGQSGTPARPLLIWWA
jgi:hypothetical protein